MVTIVSVFVFVIVTIGLSYYCYRVNNSQVSMMIEMLFVFIPSPVRERSTLVGDLRDFLLAYKWIRELRKCLKGDNLCSWDQNKLLPFTRSSGLILIMKKNMEVLCISQF